MSKRIEIEGVALTVDEGREVLAFWDHTSDRLPWCISVVKRGLAPDPTKYPRTLRLGEVPLTSSLIEAIRDAVEPWTEEPWTEAVGEIVKVGGRIGLLSLHGQITTTAEDHLRPGDVVSLPTKSPVLVRRPLKPALTLREVRAGVEVQREPGKRGRPLLHHASDREGRIPMLVERHALEWWPADTPVEIVEDAS